MFKTLAQERRSHDKYRSKRSLFFRSNSRILSKGSSFYLGHKPLYLSGTVFWCQVSTSSIYQANETCSAFLTIYLDNFLSLAFSKEEALPLTQMTLSPLQSLGIITHKLDNNSEYNHLRTRDKSSKGSCSLQQCALSASKFQEDNYPCEMSQEDPKNCQN